MIKRIRDFFESIAFAGLKPSGGPVAPKKELKWLGPLQKPVERLLSGSAPTDPLYLTNRTLAQKLRSWSLIAVPIVLLAAGIGGVLYLMEPPEAPPAKELSAAEITARLLPNMDKDIKLAPPSDVQVVEVKIDGQRLTGVVQNVSKHMVESAELVVDLTNATGSQIGAVNGTVEKIPAAGRKEFQIPIKQRDAAFALVREITTK